VSCDSAPLSCPPGR